MGQSADEIVGVPCAFSDAMAYWDVRLIGSLQDILGDAFENGDIGRGMILPGAIEVFAEVNIKHPVQAVFDLPVGSRDG